MKKTYKTIQFFIVLLSLATLKLGAQLAGVYSINQTAPSSSTNYTSITSFANDLNTLGVSGPVTVNIVANTGPYVEQVTFIQASGVSASNNVIINGNGNAMNFNSTSAAAPWTLLFNGADYTTVNDLKVNALGSTYGFALHLYNSATFNNFNNCEFNVLMNTTSTNIIPISLSATNNSYSSSGTAGQNNNNIWTSCSTSGGYFGVTFYGYTGSPYTLSNQMINCNIRDFYVYGIYSYYNYALTIRGCVIERPNVTTLTTFYGIYLSGTTVPASGMIMIDGNRIRNPFGASPTNGNTFFGIYPTMNGSSGNPIEIRNNVLSDLNFNGQILGIYNTSYQYINVVHNTISCDDVNSTYTGATYAIYYYGLNGMVKNNLITLSRGGTGQKFGLFYASTVGTGTVFSNGNCVYVAPSIASTGFYGYHFSWGNIATHATWTTNLSMDLQGSMANPGYANPANQVFLPTSYAINDLGQPIGVLTDILGNTRSVTTPDPGAYEFLNVPCSGAPAASSVLAPTFVVCPGISLPLGLSTTYTNNGLTFQWQSSTTSSVGPFTPVANATTQAFTTPTLSTQTWYQAVITCTNSTSSTAASAGVVLVAGQTISQVPYFEGFEGITRNNTLPNCSWAASNMSTTCLTYTAANLTYRLPRTGNKFASFYYNPGGTMYFWTNPIQLNTGITYSAAVWYLTEMLQGYNNWTDLSIVINTSQSATGATTIISSGNAAIALAYKLLSNTFSVNSSGLYFIGIKATGGTSSSAQYLSWDDLSITIPCGPTVNPVNLGIVATNTSICAGSPANLTASGANTYTWSTGSTGALLNNSPTASTVYIVTGTSTLTGCTNTMSQAVTVKQSPNVSIASSFPPAICAGKSYNIFASGANAYLWSNGSNNPLITVTPTVSTGYTVVGSTNGCNAVASIFVNVFNLPSVTASAPTGAICLGESTQLIGSGTGNLTYVWTSNSGVTIPAANAVVAPFTTTSYTLTGTDANGCEGTASIVMTVNACTGISEVNGANGVRIYPNPATTQISVESNNNLVKTITVLDMSGRVIQTNTTSSDNFSIELNTVANGIYFVKVQSEIGVEVVKVVKQ